jgi:hypothetical protein
MGAQLMSFYDKAKQLGSLKAQMRLAMLTGMPGPKAQSEPDSPENLAKMKEAFTKVQAEFN